MIGGLQMSVGWRYYGRINQDKVGVVIMESVIIVLVEAVRMLQFT